MKEIERALLLDRYFCCCCAAASAASAQRRSLTMTAATMRKDILGCFGHGVHCSDSIGARAFVVGQVHHELSCKPNNSRRRCAPKLSFVGIDNTVEVEYLLSIDEAGLAKSCIV